MKILAGSQAIKHWFPDFNRVPKDVDYIMPENPQPSSSSVDHLYSPVFAAYDHEVLLPDDLYTLKVSHLFWDIKWEKHIYDATFLKAKGCNLKKNLFDELFEYWQFFHGPIHRSNLEVPASKFFDNALKKYDHDFLHTLINPHPTYFKVLRDGAEVAVDESKFNLLSHQERLDLVREEVYVMAYERLAGRDYRAAYHWMLKKFIIHHAPIWEAIFIIEHYAELRKPFFNYKKHIDNELARNHR